MRLAGAWVCTLVSNWQTLRFGRFATRVGRSVAYVCCIGQSRRTTRGVHRCDWQVCATGTCRKSTDAQRPSIYITCRTYCNAGQQNQSIASANTKRAPMRLAGAAYSSVIPSAGVKFLLMVSKRWQKYICISKLFFILVFPLNKLFNYSHHMEIVLY